MLGLVVAHGASGVTPGTITTIAGGGSQGMGDGGPALSGSFSAPRCIAVDKDGNLYISDENTNRIRKVSKDGILTTLVGKGRIGDAGDGGLATEALMESPHDLALDGDGNLYFADTNNDRIRKVTPDGLIFTAAGNGLGGYSGDGGPANVAMLFSPKGIAVDAAGNLYVSDTGNHVIRKVDRAGIITTVAGNGQGGTAGDEGQALLAKISAPTGIAFDLKGNLYIADANASRVRMLRPDGTITTVAGSGIEGYSGDDGLATEASLRQPSDVAVDSKGVLFIADENGGRVRKVDPDGTITTAAGTGELGFGGDGGDGGPATQAHISWPTGVAIDSQGNLYIADNCNARIRKVFAEAAPGIFPAPTPTSAPGDANEDGKIDVRDAILVLRAALQLETLSTQGKTNADVNHDQALDVRDAILILRLALGL